MGPGDVVTWRARHFGLRLTHTSEINRYQPPHYFVDCMTKGAFKTFEHLHEFSALAQNETLMRDQLVFSSPLGPLGAIVDWLVLKEYLTRFLAERNHLIQQVAESTDWKSFIPGALQSECL